MSRPLASAAVVMILLVLSIPVVFAQELRIIRFSGRDGVNGYGRPDDTLTALVTTSLPDDAVITAGQLHLTSEGYDVPFERCYPAGTAAAGGGEGEDGENGTAPPAVFNCTLSEPYQDAFGTETYTVQLYDDAESLATSASHDLVIDGFPPRVTAFAVEPAVSADGRFAVTVTAEDFGGSEGTGCSGIRDIALRIRGSTVASAPGTEGACTLTQGLEFARDAEGRVDVCAVATDFAGQSSAPSCASVAIDRSAPAISGLSLRGQPGDFQLKYARTGTPLTADISVTIDDISGVRDETVLASLSRLNPSLGERPPDESQGGSYTWLGIPITSPGTCGVTVAAADTLGNVASQELTCTIGVDDAGPVPVSIAAEASLPDGTPVLARGGRLTVTFTEAGIGMSTANAALDLGALGLGIPSADACVPGANRTWDCFWDALDAPAAPGSYPVAVASAADALGNPLAAPLSRSIAYDPEPPVIIAGPFFTVIPAIGRRGNLTAHGDSIRLQFLVRGADASEADFTEIGGEPAVPGACIPVEDDLTALNCTFFAGIEASGPANATVTVTFTDHAGNAARHYHSFFIHGLSDEAAPDFWRIAAIDCTPRPIDRRVTPLLEHKSYCRVQLAKKSPASEVRIATVAVAPGELASCTSPDGNITDFLADVKTINIRPGTTDPFLVLTLAATEFPQESIRVSCPLNVFSQVGDLITRNPEPEQVNATLSFYASPLGELNANVDREIERDTEKALNTLKWVATLEKIARYSEAVCTIKDILVKVITILEAVMAGLGALAAALTGYGESAKESVVQLKNVLCKSVQDRLDGVYQDLYNVLTEICGFVNCQSSTGKTSDTGFTDYGPVGAWCGNFVKQFATGSFVGVDLAKDSFDIKDSIILSSMCLCIPGIIYGLNKYRQIKCYGAYCKAELKDSGMPLSHCEDIEGYLMCTWVVGEIFSLIPFNALYEFVVDLLKTIYENPIALLVAAAVGLCGDSFCNAKEDEYNIGHFACAIVKIVQMAADVLSDIQSIKKSGFWRTGEDFCEKLEDAT